MNNPTVILPENLKDLASYKSIMLNGGMGISLPNHQQAILKAYVDVCKESGNKFIPVSFSTIEKRLRCLPEKNLIPNDLTLDVPVLHRKGWIKSKELKEFALTDNAKEWLQETVIPA